MHPFQIRTTHLFNCTNINTQLKVTDLWRVEGWTENNTTADAETQPGIRTYWISSVVINPHLLKLALKYISLFAHTSYKVVHRKSNCIQTKYIKR